MKNNWARHGIIPMYTQHLGVWGKGIVMFDANLVDKVRLCLKIKEKWKTIHIFHNRQEPQLPLLENHCAISYTFRIAGKSRLMW